MKTGLHKSQLAYILHEYAFHGKRGMYLFDDCSELIKQLAHSCIFYVNLEFIACNLALEEF